MGPLQKHTSFVTKETSGISNTVRRHVVDPSAERPKVQGSAAFLIEKLRRCRDAVHEIESGFQDDLYNRLQEAVQIAKRYEADSEAWAECCNDEFWTRCKTKRPRPKDDLNTKIVWIVRFIFQVTSTDGPRYNRAYKYWRALQGYIRDNVPASAVAHSLRAEGAEFAYVIESRDRVREEESNAPSSANADQADGKRLEPSIDPGDRLSKPEKRALRVKQQKPDVIQPVRYRRSSDAASPPEITDERYVFIEVDEKELNSVNDMRGGDVGVIKFRCSGRIDHGWIRYVSTNLKITGN